MSAARRATTVHPRVCGEHCSAFTFTLIERGSSPRLRGTLFRGAWARGSARFIPASAGNTIVSCASDSRRSVHPRVCGEHMPSNSAQAAASGSSPRLRGTRCCAPDTVLSRRFIPASAGNTREPYRGRQKPSVHPRVCGEHGQRYSRSGGACGSSPRLRGTLLKADVVKLSWRFIPASAGNTFHYLRPPFSCSVHPRVCGEHFWQMGLQRSTPGSSPRLRGTLLSRYSIIYAPRFIPASAGNTSSYVKIWVPVAVHPRVCGEHPMGVNYTFSNIGSSPRLRGTLGRKIGFIGIVRFIPASAGNTLIGATAPTRHPVHPRVCGEHVAGFPASNIKSGSSPRLRGTLRTAMLWPRRTRFIPASAGNT